VRIPLLPGSLRAHNKTEPGYYADGEYGIRIENVVIVREAQTPNNFGNKGFLGFERVTMVFLSLVFQSNVLTHSREGPYWAKPDRLISPLCGRTLVGGCVS
jgi:hypothetical protein